MYTDLNLYYLNLLGIIPWVNKSSVGLLPNSLKLLIVTATDLNVKEQNLLNNILFFIGVQEEQVQHLDVQRFMSLNKRIKAQTILSFGSHNLFSHLEKSTALIEVESLDYILDNPAAKKKLGTQLYHYISHSNHL